jgi:hypothetical protein
LGAVDAVGAEEADVHAGGRQTLVAEPAGAAEKANGMTTRSPLLILVTCDPTSSTTPTASWPIDCPVSERSIEAYGHRSLPQTQARVTRTIASVGSTIAASGTSSTRTSLAAYMPVALMPVTKAPIQRR